MQREWFYGARVRGLAAAVLILLAVVLILVLATLPPETLPAETLPAETLSPAPTEQAASATPTSLPSRTPSPTHELTPTVTCLPPSTMTPTPTATTIPSATYLPIATSTPYPATVVPSPTATSTLETTGILLRVVLTGELEGLKRDGQIAWPAVQLQCWNASGQEIGRIGLTHLDGKYRLPDETARVQLWIGSELDGADWWQNWDSPPADATSPEIILIIARVKRDAPPPTQVAPPVPRPTSTPCPP